MIDLSAMLAHVINIGGSDLHLGADTPPRIRVKADLRPAPFPPLSAEQILAAVEEVLTPARFREFLTTGEADFSLTIPDLGRFRGNACRQQGGAALVFRRVLPAAMSAAALGLPPIVTTLAEEHRGIVLVTGPTGSGKTTTLAAMIDHINNTRACKIVTIEDPIEVMHTHKRSVIWQREIGTDTDDYTQALRRVFRQDPDVISIGEMRDNETVSVALSAAETGHLVLSTLHTTNATEAINRVIDFFPSAQQQQTRHMLASVLKGVISQRLVSRVDGAGRTAAIEAMIVTGRVADRIIDPYGAGDSLDDQIADGGYYGMQTFDQSLLGLVQSGDISVRTAIGAASNQHDLRIALQVAGIAVS